jgi:hypothetical protein
VCSVSGISAGFTVDPTTGKRVVICFKLPAGAAAIEEPASWVCCRWLSARQDAAERKDGVAGLIIRITAVVAGSGFRR